MWTIPTVTPADLLMTDTTTLRLELARAQDVCEVIKEQLKDRGHVFDGSATVRVRIAVAISTRGLWAAMGCDWWSDDTSAEDALRKVDDMAATIRWLEADVPLPVETVVTGEVVP